MSNNGYFHRYLDHVALSLEVYSFGTTGRIKGLELTHQNFIAITTSVNHSEMPVLIERFDFQDMLKAVERFKVTYMSVLSPLVVAMAKSEVVMRLGPGAEVNTPKAEKLYSLAGNWAGLGPNTLLLDICRGTRTLGLTLAHRFGIVTCLRHSQQSFNSRF
ncbi:hypothetical protein Tco_1042108 [Tanacetum coccineum]|uniref:Uncharacterized protein n=1 Tax=Tanacetum coccineum TaxID=301880 RepID=A0ABQ5GKR2_9ASTR